MKAGSIEREQQEDFVYKRLYQLAEIIKTRYSNDPKLKEIYFVVTNEGTPVTESVKRLPVYTDEYNMFTQSEVTPATNMFLEKMSTDLEALPNEKVHQLLSNRTIDGQKEVLRSFVTKHGREEFLRTSIDETCKSCWSEVMRYVFVMSVEILTVELKRRAHQIREMTAKGYFTDVDAKDLVVFVESIILKVEQLLSQSRKPKLSKHAWIELIESLFRLMVGLVNEIMMRYVQYVNFKRQSGV
jgi:hypothetical protein